MSVQVSYKNQTLFFILFISIILILIEITAHIYEEFENPPCKFLKKDAYQNVNLLTQYSMCYQYQLIEYLIPPQENSQHLSLVPNQHFTHVNVNNFGFRGTDISIDKPKDTYRIFVVGGSTVFGFVTLNDNNTISGYLENYLKQDSSYDIEVINAGISWADSIVEKELIKNKLIQFQPDMVVLYDGWNDASHRTYTDGRNGIDIDWDQEPIELKKGSGLLTKLTTTFPFYRTPFFVSSIINSIDFKTPDNFETKNVAKENMLELKQKINLSWNKNINEVCNFANENNFKLIAVLQPILGTGQKSFSNDEKYNFQHLATQQQETLAIINSLKFDESSNCSSTLDLRNIFDNTKTPIFYDPGHMNDKGNEIIASQIYENVKLIIEK